MAGSADRASVRIVFEEPEELALELLEAAPPEEEHAAEREHFRGDHGDPDECWAEPERGNHDRGREQHDVAKHEQPEAGAVSPAWA